MPSAERMMAEYARQADRERGAGDAGLGEHFRCRKIAEALSSVVAKDIKVRIARTR